MAEEDEEEKTPARQGDFVKIIVISVVYCLIQIPNITPTSFQISKSAYNKSLKEVSFPLMEIEDYAPVFAYFSAAAVSSVVGTLVTLTGHYDIPLLLFSIISIARIFIGGTQDTIKISFLGALSGLGFGGSYVTTTLYLVLLSDGKKTARNFSFFAACVGASYFLYAGVLGITNPCTLGPYRVSSYVAALSGLIIMILHVIRSKGTVRREEIFSKDSLDFINGAVRYSQHISLTSKFEAGVAVVFFTYSCELLAVVFARCALLTGSYRYHAEAMIPYGIGFMLSAIQWSYCYKRWASPLRTVISTILLVTGLIMALFFRHDACATPDLLESWYVVPFISLIAGQGLGSLTCETYTVINVAWTSRFKFCLLLILETVWTLCFFIFFAKVSLATHCGILATLALLYCASMITFQRRAKKFHQRMDDYLMKNSQPGTSSKYGSTTYTV